MKRVCTRPQNSCHPDFICSGFSDIVRILLDHGAHPKCKATHERFNDDYDTHGDNLSLENCEYIKYAQYTPLYFACKNGHTDVVIELLLLPGEFLKQALEEANNQNGNPDGSKRYEQLWETVTQIAKMLVMYNADYASCVRHSTI